MAYIQKNNPVPKTGCGRRRVEQMTNPFKKETKMEVNPNASKVNKPETYATAPIKGAKEYDEASIVKRAFMTDPRVKNLTVPFGGGKLGKAIKLGKIAKNLFKKKLDVKALKQVSKELKKASNTHAGQAEKINSALPKKIKRTKISAPCKAAAKRKFKVWPSAYASGWGVRCTRNPRKYLKRK
jgi:hypothetical protein